MLEPLSDLWFVGGLFCLFCVVCWVFFKNLVLKGTVNTDICKLCSMAGCVSLFQAYSFKTTCLCK